ncbi:MAG: hypothetical protein NVS3B12_21890 [Acidimicrobiales bacterium]
MHPLARPVVDAVRRQLRAGAERSPGIRHLIEVADRELRRALDNDVYGGAYFGQGRDPTDRAYLSGYERYDRDTSNANVAAYLAWRYLPASTSLDVGCATGFVVEALRELGVDAEGVDISQYAVDHAALGAAGHIRRADLRHGLGFHDRSFELVTALETLEHLPPDEVPGAVSEIARVAGKWVLCTIPSFGPNRNGPGGWFQVKARDDRVAHYESLGPAYQGPLPHDDIYRDATGEPIEGHLTMASFEWWTERFAQAGMVRCDATERRIHPELARLGLTKYWNLYVFRQPSAPEPPVDGRRPDEIRGVLARFDLADRIAAPDDAAAVREALGT